MAARRLRDGGAKLGELVDLFRRGYFYARTPTDAPRLFVADLGERGRWACVFSSPQKLANAVGECNYIGMPGADFLDLMPPGVGLVLDPEDDHALALRSDVVVRVARIQVGRTRHE